MTSSTRLPSLAKRYALVAHSVARRAAARLPLLLGLFGGMVAAAGSSGIAAETFDSAVAPFLKRHCFSCHGENGQEAGIRYDRLAGFRAEDSHLWTLVHEKLSAGEMPPPERPQPASEETRAVLSWIERQQRALGRGTTRRLNRRELAAALRDLTSLSVDYAAALPGDGKIDGFDTGAEGLQDAASSVEQMMEVVSRAVRGIRFLDAPSELVFSADLRQVKDARRALDDWKSGGAVPKMRGYGQPGTGLLIQTRWVGERGGTSVTVPVPADRRGVLRLELTVAASKAFPDLPHPHLWVEVGGKTIDYREVQATVDKPLELAYDVQLEDVAVQADGVKIELHGKVEVPYAVNGFENEDRTKPEDRIPGGPGLFRPAFDRKLPPEQQPVPFVVLQAIEVQPDYVAAWPPASWGIELGEATDTPAYAVQLLALWMERAWRRPVHGAERQRFLGLYEELRRRGLSFDASLRAAFQAVLLSGPFRYLSSPGAAGPGRAPYEIASRLSFLLLGTPPDERLRQLAAEGRLGDPHVLEGEVDRLLSDPRSDGFFRPFVTQWLELEQPITLTMDYFQQQDFRFGRYLKASMREETIRYIAEMFRRNRPARELIDSDWTMMNNALARYYGYEGVEDGRFRQVTFRDSDPRGGGILGHAGIQSMLCWMGDNWVIYRGAWTLRHILDDPPPPPPLEVPELDPTAGENRGKTFRELLVQHQQDQRCAVCHKTMDPLGFAFQNFDLSGRWRDVEYERYLRNELDGKIEWRGTGKSRPVDAAGRLPRGEPFRGFAECKQLMIDHYQQDIVRGIMKNLVLYATGRKPDVADRAQIRTIMRQHADRGYPLGDMLKGLVRSPIFLEPRQGTP